MTNVYDFTVTRADGTTYQLDKYRNNILLIVNTATNCGLRDQFKALEALYQDYRTQNVVVLGFPSNQFKQELATGAEAQTACALNHGVTFPMHDITVINGPDADPLFLHLQHEQSGALGDAIKWNFTKFLVDQNGQVVARFAPQTDPDAIRPAIDTLLSQNKTLT